MPTSQQPYDDRADPWAGLDPYAQLVKSLLPRAMTITLFDAAGTARWSSDPGVGADLLAVIAEVRQTAVADPQYAGQMRMLDRRHPVYLCALRDDGGTLLALLAVTCRPDAAGAVPRTFSLVCSLLRPALECLRRHLMASEEIARLSRTAAVRGEDLDLLLAGPPGSAPSADGSGDLRGFLRTAAAHLHCELAALLVPEKGIVLLHSDGERGAHGQLLARTHRKLLSLARLRGEPVIVNRVAASTPGEQIPYRILSCPVRHVSGRTMGVLALFRADSGRPFVERDGRLAEFVARKISAAVETTYDNMSGLLTRQAFERRVHAAVAEDPHGTRWSLLYVDSDQLHVINDHCGMHVGDMVISQIGELIRTRLPPRAFAARISGDRFAALLPVGIDDAALFAETLRESAARLSTIHADRRVDVSISVGVAPLDMQNGGLTHSLAAAETACKAAKDRGRDRVEVYEDTDASIVRRFTDINIATSLRQAVTAGRMRLEAQLILPLGASADARPHFELLLRVIDLDGETLGPDRFLSAANRYQLMPMIDRWVIDTTIAMLRPHAALLESRPVVFAVNFSGQSLSDDDFGDHLLRRVESSGLDPAIFCFEITETATMANIARAETLMRRLRRLGCGVALDDFGTGLSSLSYLRQLPVTLLKIDGSFVRDILRDPRSESMVRAIAQLARSMSIGTVAEYVETEEIRIRLEALGVDYGQGFAIGRPMPFEDVLSELPVLASATPLRGFAAATGTCDPAPLVAEIAER